MVITSQFVSPRMVKPILGVKMTKFYFFSPFFFSPTLSHSFPSSRANLGLEPLKVRPFLRKLLLWMMKKKFVLFFVGLLLSSVALLCVVVYFNPLFYPSLTLSFSGVPILVHSRLKGSLCCGVVVTIIVSILSLLMMPFSQLNWFFSFFPFFFFLPIFLLFSSLSLRLPALLVFPLDQTSPWLFLELWKKLWIFLPMKRRKRRPCRI